MFYDNGVALISESDISNLNWFLGLACIMSLKFRKNQDPGKQAGMIILSDNPVDEITNTKKIEGVINNGQFIE